MNWILEYMNLVSQLFTYSLFLEREIPLFIISQYKNKYIPSLPLGENSNFQLVHSKKIHNNRYENISNSISNDLCWTQKYLEVVQKIQLSWKCQKQNWSKDAHCF